MQRITALTAPAVPAASQTILDATQKAIGMVPNLYRTIAHSPAALAGYTHNNHALAGGVLPAALREQVALLSAGYNGCDYCASAHTLIGKGAGLSAAQASESLRGRADNAKAQAALDFARAVLTERGKLSDVQLQAVRAAGYSEAEIVEIVAHVALNVFTNYLNNVATTKIDFPPVSTQDVKLAA